MKISLCRIQNYLAANKQSVDVELMHIAARDSNNNPKLNVGMSHQRNQLCHEQETQLFGHTKETSVSLTK